MTKYVYDFSEGDKDQKDLLGGKGANLAEMTKLGLPVPPGFTISTEACREYLVTGVEPAALRVEVTMALRRLEDALGKRLGDIDDPLLVSVRSGAKFSMPGMMETVLNVGLNDYSVNGLIKVSNNERFAWDSYRRLIQMFGKTVLDIEGEIFADALQAANEKAGVATEVDLTADQLKEVVETFKAIIQEHSGRDFPQDPREQLDLATRAVFDSWNTSRARLYRRRERIADDLGTAVNICSMVFGNLGETSGTGVAFTRDPASGKTGAYGDYLPNAQGEDVVAGIRNTFSLDELNRTDPTSFNELMKIMRKLETHYRDLCDIEFTVEKGKLWMLQTRVGKRTAAAAFRIATQLVDESLITMDEALIRVNGSQLAQLMFPQFDSASTSKIVASGMAASPGAAVGKAVFDSATAVKWAEKGERVVLVRRETNPDDLEGMIAATGILTARGGKTSHAAVVARGMGKTCVCGADAVDVSHAERTATIGDIVIKEGDMISIDGSTGHVYLGELAVVPSPVSNYLENGLAAAIATENEEIAALVTAVDRILKHADSVRRLKVRTNADTAEDSKWARNLGAEGIGLCRTEHMFLGDRRVLIERVILADNSEDRNAALEALLPMQQKDFEEIFEEMDSLPVTVRLLDPPLHEFLPDRTDLMVEVALGKERNEDVSRQELLLSAVDRLHESNPMLGLTWRATWISCSWLVPNAGSSNRSSSNQAIRAGGNPKVEIMIPLVGSVMELHLIRDEMDVLLAQIASEENIELPFSIGTMIELPRAALTAQRIAEAAEFFSFGTNDLTQTTWGFSRDDVEASFFATYLDRGIFTVSPFESLDVDGVGALIKIAVEKGRATRPDIKLGVCGEHGGDPESIKFFHRSWT
jgi:pyruvate, orthophosphate dikinase